MVQVARRAPLPPVRGAAGSAALAVFATAWAGEVLLARAPEGALGLRLVQDHPWLERITELGAAAGPYASSILLVATGCLAALLAFRPGMAWEDRLLALLAATGAAMALPWSASLMPRPEPLARVALLLAALVAALDLRRDRTRAVLLLGIALCLLVPARLLGLPAAHPLPRGLDAAAEIVLLAASLLVLIDAGGRARLAAGAAAAGTVALALLHEGAVRHLAVQVAGLAQAGLPWTLEAALLGAGIAGLTALAIGGRWVPALGLAVILGSARMPGPLPTALVALGAVLRR
jgi:hypothetical protein